MSASAGKLRLKIADRLARTRWAINAQFGKSYVSAASPVVIGGCPRSGTTLLRMIVDTHPNICCGPESYLFLDRKMKLKKLSDRFDISTQRLQELLKKSRSRAEFIDLFFADYSKLNNKARWADKTPQNVRLIDYVFAHFPSAKFVHVLRDGRDAVCSLRTHPKYKLVDGELVPRNTNRPIAGCARMWRREVEQGLKFRGDPRYFEIRYEEIVGDTEATLKKLIAFLGEPWDECMLKFHEHKTASRKPTRNIGNPGASAPISDSSMGRWQRDLSAEDVAAFKEIAGPLLISLGYAADNNWQPA